MKLARYILIAVLCFMASAACLQQPVSRADSGPHVSMHRDSYSKAREGFHTKLIRVGRSPQEWHSIRTPRGVIQIQYESRSLKLKAWLNRPASVNKRYPAILFLHGGFAFSEDDWQMSQPYRDAGFVVMSPILRGENGQRGNFTMYYDEVEDVVAAAEYLRNLPYVDANRVFVAGHSAGGTLALLTALTYDHFRAAASFSGSPDQLAFLNNTPDMKGWVPFEVSNIRELEMRSPLSFAPYFKCPLRIYYGAREPRWFQLTSQRTAEVAKQNHVDAEAVQVAGDHYSAAPEEIRKSIEFFLQLAMK